MNPPSSETVGAPSSASLARSGSPARLRPAAWRAAFQRAAKKIVHDRVSLSAGSLAYH